MFTIRTGSIVQGTPAKFVAIFTAFMMVGVFSTSCVMFLWIVRKLNITLSDKLAWIIMPAAWVVSEYIRAVLFSVLVWGPGGRVGAHWTFGDLGYWLVDTPTIYLARWGGLYLLSFTVGLLAVSAVKAVVYRRLVPLFFVVIVVTVLSSAGYFVWQKADGKRIDIMSVQYGSTFDQVAYSEETTKMLAKEASDSIDLMVLPEYSHLWERFHKRDTAAVDRVLRSTGLVIDTRREPAPKVGIGHNQVVYRKQGGEVVHTSDKWFLIPGGEYVPYSYQAILAYAGQDQLIKKFNQQKTVDPAKQKEQPFVSDAAVIGAQACSSVISPVLYQSLVKQGATILTNSASLDTLGVGGLYHQQARTMAHLHAVSNARPFAQAARGSRSYVIDHNGHFVAQTQNNGYRVIHGSVVTNSKKTLYTVLGDWPVWSSGLLLIGLFTYQNKKSIIRLSINKKRKNDGQENSKAEKKRAEASKKIK